MTTDDPKFTAHVLGEMEDLTPEECAEIEALLADDPTAIAEAAETKAFAARLRTELAGEETTLLRNEQRVALFAELKGGDSKRKITRFPHRATMLVAMAASVIVAVSAALFYMAVQRERDAAAKALATNGMNGTGMITAEADESDVGVGAFAAKSTAALQSPPRLSASSADASDEGKMRMEAPQESQLVTTATPEKPPQAAAAIPAALPVFEKGSDPTPQTPAQPPPKDFDNAAGSFPNAASGPRNAANGYVNNERRGDLPYWKFFPAQPIRLEPVDHATYDAMIEHDFASVRENPLSTFSIDVDTASYSIARRYLNDGQLPPRDAVRIEEMLNYFSYDYPSPRGEDVPFSAIMEVATCPWEIEHRLVRIGLKGREMAKEHRPPSNLVFLIDVSGSMDMPNKLPLLKQCFGLLIDQLGPEDQVSIVTYAGESGCALEPTHDKQKMREAMRQLEAGGGTNGASGVQMAYEIAQKSFIKGGTNRVILATDGDWNVGVTNENDLLAMIAGKAKTGVFLTALGFGVDNLKDTMLVKLADRGNGHYAYIDTLLEAKKVFVEQLTDTLVNIAKDVKIQVEFNPAQVVSYRLIGYEKRALAKEDFNDDRKDAGEIGAGHTVTALYEIVPVGKEPPAPRVDPLKYQPQAAVETVTTPQPQAGEPSKELLTLKLRYKAPDGDISKLEFPLTDNGATWEKSSPDFRFASAVAGYGMLLRDSAYKGNATWNSVAEWAHEGLGADASGYRAEFLSLVEKARECSKGGSN